MDKKKTAKENVRRACHIKRENEKASVALKQIIIELRSAYPDQFAQADARRQQQEDAAPILDKRPLWLHGSLPWG